MPPGMAEAQAAAAEAGAMVPGSRKRKQCPSKNCGCPAQKQPCFGLPGVPCRVLACCLCALLGLACLQQIAGLHQQCTVSLASRLFCVQASCTHLASAGRTAADSRCCCFASAAGITLSLL